MIALWFRSCAPESYSRPSLTSEAEKGFDRGRTRTCNPQIRSLVPYPLGHTAPLGQILRIEWRRSKMWQNVLQDFNFSWQKRPQNKAMGTTVFQHNFASKWSTKIFEFSNYDFCWCLPSLRHFGQIVPPPTPHTLISNIIFQSVNQSSEKEVCSKYWEYSQV